MSARSGKRVRHKTVVIGRETLTLAAAQSRTVRFTLRGLAARWLAKHRVLRAKLTVTSTPGGKATTVTRVVTFKATKKHH